MRAFVAVTDKDWYQFLAGRPDLDEVNFWQPGGNGLDNGEHYHQLEGSALWVPGSSEAQPRADLLEWHADTVFRG